MTKPQFTLIPSAYRVNNVYSVLPVDGSGDMTFSRGSEATRVREDGLIETVDSNIPRLDWLNSNCPSLLLEPQRANLQIRSEEFDNAAWTKTFITVTANDTISPDGTESADKLQRTNTAASYIYDAITIGFGAKTYTNSIFVKKGEGSFLAIRVRGSSAWVDLRFNFLTKQIISYTATGIFTAISSKVEEFDNGWFRIYFTYTTDGYNVLTHSYSPRFTQGDIDDTDVNNNANCYIWGSQVEEQIYGSSYIKTEDGIATRNQDFCTDGGDADLFNITEGSFFVDVLPYNAGLVSTISLSNNSTSQRILIQFQSNGTQVRLFSSGSVDNYQTITFNQRNKILVTFKLNEYKFYINGALVSTDTSATVPTGLDRVNFSNSTANSDFFQGEVNDTRVYDKVLTEAEAIKLTTI